MRFSLLLVLGLPFFTAASDDRETTPAPTATGTKAPTRSNTYSSYGGNGNGNGYQSGRGRPTPRPTKSQEDDYSWFPGELEPPNMAIYGAGHVAYGLHDVDGKLDWQSSHVGIILGQETSIQTYSTMRYDQINWNCVAAMSKNYLDGITKRAPILRAPEQYHTSRHRVLCSFFAFSEQFPALWPGATKFHEMHMEKWEMTQHQLTDKQRDAMGACLDKSSGVASCLRAMMPQGDDKDVEVAAFFGGLVGVLQVRDVMGDAMNATGRKNKNGKTCTANCQRYQDWTGYQPKNPPGEELKDAKKWQPLGETNGNGFFYYQQHVSPQAGKMKNTMVPADYLKREVDAPDYDYAKENAKVIKNVASLAGGTSIKDEAYLKRRQIEVMDDKTKVLAGVLNASMNGARGIPYMAMSHEEKALFMFGYTGVEFDAVAVTWKEKVRHDHVRPTTLVQNMDETTVEWWNGQKISSKDWTPYIRVMPHAEHISGSATICQVIGDYVNEFAKDQLKKDTVEWSFEVPAMNSNTVKSRELDEPKKPFFMKLSSMDEVVDVCSNSRLWGGMHYSQAVPMARKLVEGYGKAAYEMTKKLRNNEAMPKIPKTDQDHTSCASRKSKRRCRSYKECSWSKRKCVPQVHGCQAFTESWCNRMEGVCQVHKRQGAFKSCGIRK